MFESLANKRTIPLLLAGAVGSSMLAGCGGSKYRTETVTITEPGATTPAIPTVPVKERGPDVMLKGSHHREIVEFSSGSPTFGDYRHFSNPGPPLPEGAVVQVDCLLRDKEEANNSTHGLWYHIIGPAALRGLYSPSNNFENGVDNPNAGPAADPQVPPCPTS